MSWHITKDNQDRYPAKSERRRYPPWDSEHEQGSTDAEVRLGGRRQTPSRQRETESREGKQHDFSQSNTKKWISAAMVSMKKWDERWASGIVSNRIPTGHMLRNLTFSPVFNACWVFIIGFVNWKVKLEIIWPLTWSTTLVILSRGQGMNGSQQCFSKMNLLRKLQHRNAVG